MSSGQHSMSAQGRHVMRMRWGCVGTQHRLGATCCSAVWDTEAVLMSPTHAPEVDAGRRVTSFFTYTKSSKFLYVRCTISKFGVDRKVCFTNCGHRCMINDGVPHGSTMHGAPHPHRAPCFITRLGLTISTRTPQEWRYCDTTTTPFDLQCSP